ncbi:ADP-ribosylglycohydrolase family protein [Amycolatopsis suaedae]|uniref:ADP-ribosylglycohydrolase n=1 Tax=Amycolatopsis suaedae TaxID=2510978 RepID=A0A4Q7JB36_9PSEU|nr:ADP-ribosylglycohydrolase family protein [Amycolatopsis suaedae]RZQ65020.1 ADP-ribosylglycohydrolase [Amycolatopsis suaedae]
MEAAEAIAKVDEWLREGADGDEPTVGVDRDNVHRIPEGWSVPYNTLKYLETGEFTASLFPMPYVLVREPQGDLRHANPQPGGISIPIQWRSREYWGEFVDPEFRDAGIGDIGVPERAVAGYYRVVPGQGRTGEERANPGYLPGPVRRGMPRPISEVEWLLACRLNGWIDHETMVVGVSARRVFVPLLEDGSLDLSHVRDRDGVRELDVYTSSERLRAGTRHWRHVDVRKLLEDEPATTFYVYGCPPYLQKITAAELTGVLERFPYTAPIVDEVAAAPEVSDGLTRLAAEAAERLGVDEPVGKPIGPAEKARQRGFTLTERECQLTVLGWTWERLHKRAGGVRWPDNLAANGLMPWYDDDGKVVPVTDRFGKYFFYGYPGFRYGWQRVAGAYAGFALGEALGSTVDGLTRAEIEQRFGAQGLTELVPEPDQPARLGPLTQRLLFLTEGVIRSPHRENPEAHAQFAPAAARGLLRWLRTQGEPAPVEDDGWLIKVSGLHAKRDPDPAELDAIRRLAVEEPGTGTGPAALLAAMPGVLTAGGPDTALPGGVTAATRTLAGLTHQQGFDLDAAGYLALVFEKAFTKDPVASPLWACGREAVAGAGEELTALVDETLPALNRPGLRELRDPESLGAGRDTRTVLGQVIAAVAGFENYPEDALLRAVNHSGRSALTGALAGALIGAYHGIPGLPQHWLSKLELRYLVQNLATDAFWHFERTSPVFDRPEWARRYPRR